MNPFLPPTFAHGVHPSEHKETADLAITRMPFVPRYVLLLGQHAGKPSVPIVSPGDRVGRGQVLATADGFMSTTLHAPAAGEIASLGRFRHPDGSIAPALELVTDPFASQRLEAATPPDLDSLTLEGFITEVQRAGLVGLGGAAFPSHVKYAVPEGKHVDRLLVNGCECEPYLTCDHRLMVERAEAIVRGIQITARFLGVRRTTIGVERNKPDAIDALARAVAGASTRSRGATEGGHASADGAQAASGHPRDHDHELEIDVVALETKYPQGAEKMLIKSLFGLEVPAGKLPIDVGMIVNNVGTMAGIADYFDESLPLIERVVTVAGPGIERPANLLVPIGTPVRDLVEHCGGLTAGTREVLLGGPMMGRPIASLDVPVLKGTSGVLAFTAEQVEKETEYACVRCGRCLEACPAFLNPSRLARLARANRFEEMDSYFALDCMECGSCSYACPSNIPIVHLIRVAKGVIKERKR